MELTEGEKLSALWIKLYGYFEARLNSNRLTLEGPVSEKEADKLRGRIAEDKLFLNLHEDVPKTIPNLEV
jgi:hypothetical protein